MKSIELNTTQLETARLFYVRRLGLPLLTHSATHLTILIGWTLLTFRQVDEYVGPGHLTIQVPTRLFEVLCHFTESSKTADPTIANTATYLHDPAGNLLAFSAKD